MEPSEQEEDGSSQGKILHHFVSQVTPVTVLCLWGRRKALEWSRRNSRTAVSRMCFIGQECFWKDRTMESALWSTIQSLYNHCCNYLYTNCLVCQTENQTELHCISNVSIKSAQVYHVSILFSNTITTSHFLFQSTLKVKRHEKKWIYTLHPVTKIRPIRYRSVFWIIILLPSSNSEWIVDFWYCVARKCIHLWSILIYPLNQWIEKRLGHNFTGQKSLHE